MTDDRLTAALTRHLDAGGALPDLGPPYDDLLAGLVSGTLLDDERQAALQMLDEQPGYRALLARVDEATAAERPATKPSGRLLHWPRIAAAAAVVLGIGAGVLLFGKREAPQTPDEQLVASANALRAAHPHLFQGFSPLTAPERAERFDDGRRGGIELVAPRGAVLTDRPTFSWKPPDGVTSIQLTIVSEEGETVLSETTTEPSMAWPAARPGLAPGRYVWQVVAKATGRRLTASLAFSRLHAKGADDYRQAIEEIRAQGGALAPVLAAHYALRLDLLEEARRLLEDAGDSPLAAETRAWLASRLGE